MKTIKFGRGVENRYGHKQYFSHCGLFMIEQRHYVLPYASVGYTLSVVQPAPEGLSIPRSYRETDSLADAKGNATLIMEELADDAKQGA
jgi:hypothetical protein